MSELDLLRSISEAVFHRPHQLEVAQAVAASPRTFEAGEIIEATRRRAIEEGSEPPSRSSARKNLQKLAKLHVVNHVQSTSTGSPDIWTRESSTFWRWLDELPAKVGP